MQSNVRIGKLVICSVIVTIISEVVYWVGAIADMRYYTNSAYAEVWSKVMIRSARYAGAHSLLIR